MTDPLLVTGAALAVALICLDQTAVGQVLISQPLVGGWILGALFGRPLEGLAAGTLLQFLCLTDMTLGASIPPDSSFAALVGTAFTLTVTPPPGWDASALLGAAVILFFPLAWLARGLDVFIRRVNRRWTGTAETFIARGRYGAAQLAALGGIPLFFARAFLLCWLVLWFAGFLTAAAPGWATLMSGPLGLLARLVPFAGLGVVAARQRRAGATAAVTLSFGLGLLLVWGMS